MRKKHIIIAAALIATLFILDYLNIPSRFGFKGNNLNINFWIGILNNIVIIVLYAITYKKIDEKAIKREENKYAIPVLLFQKCYQECKNYINLLNEGTVEEHIIPKTDFNSTNNPIMNNLQGAPFSNENIIMDFVKDGQVTKAQIEGYFRVKEKYRQYIIMRITFYDDPHIYDPLKIDLYKMIEYEIKRLHT